MRVGFVYTGDKNDFKLLPFESIETMSLVSSTYLCLELSFLLRDLFQFFNILVNTVRDSSQATTTGVKNQRFYTMAKETISFFKCTWRLSSAQITFFFCGSSSVIIAQPYLKKALRLTKALFKTNNLRYIIIITLLWRYIQKQLLVKEIIFDPLEERYF